MTLYLIGLGLGTEQDITLRGLEAVKKADKIYLENYTSLLQCSVADLENYYGKKIIISDREKSEHAQEIVTAAKNDSIAFLVIGDPFSATTHIELYKLAQEQKIPVEVINNASVLTAIGITGLQLYKFGRTTSIPFLQDHPNLETPYHVYRNNLSLDLHTLFLLDLDPKNNHFMSVKEAISTLENIESRLHQNLITPQTKAIGVARVGSKDCLIKFGTMSDIKQIDFGPPPHCLIIPGKLHFAEEEMLTTYY
jgi:diphthine synthase